MRMIKKTNNPKVNLVVKAMFAIAIIKLRIHFEVSGEFCLVNK